MKLSALLIPVMIIQACQNNSAGRQKQVIRDTIVKRDTIYKNQLSDWQNEFGLTHDELEDSIWRKPVNYYLNNPKCDPTAKDFYLGVFRPTDNNTTAHLLSLVTTDDKTLRPFYRWILDKTIFIQDGAVAEYTGIPARLYAEKFPKEFFEYVDLDSSGKKYLDWTGSIGYSGYLDNEDYEKTDELKFKMTNKMKSNCSSCPISIKNRIHRFVQDCFK